MTFHCVIAQEIKTLFIDLIMDEIWVLKSLFLLSFVILSPNLQAVIRNLLPGPLQDGA